MKNTGNESLDHHEMLQRIEAKLDALTDTVSGLVKTRHKSIEWIGSLSEHIESLDMFREEVRATFEPFVNKLNGMDEVVRILRHATSDVSRRMEDLEKSRRGELSRSA